MTTTTRRNRKTGNIVTAYQDEFLGWFTICELHETATQHHTKTAAIEWLADPTVWCEKCAENCQ